MPRTRKGRGAFSLWDEWDGNRWQHPDDRRVSGSAPSARGGSSVRVHGRSHPGAPRIGERQRPTPGRALPSAGWRERAARSPRFWPDGSLAATEGRSHLFCGLLLVRALPDVRAVRNRGDPHAGGPSSRAGTGPCRGGYRFRHAGLCGHVRRARVQGRPRHRGRGRL